jgi:hypothetical protein
MDITENNEQVLSDVDSEIESAILLSDSSESSGTDYTTTTNSDTEEEEKVEVEEPVPIDNLGVPVIDVGIQVQEEELSCGICYKVLDMTNSVVTNCGHYHCNTCFFRWIEVNATCSQCRAPIDSKTNLTDEQFYKESQEAYQVYTKLLRDNNKLYKESNKLYRNFAEIRTKTEQFLARQIRLRQQMDETQGYNEGYLAGAYEFFHGSEKKKFNSDNLEFNKKNTNFMRGFHEGISVEYRRLHRLQKKCIKKKKRNIKIKKQKKQTDLYDCGFVMEEKNPFVGNENFTIGSSDDGESKITGGPDDDLISQFQTMSI